MKMDTLRPEPDTVSPYFALSGLSFKGEGEPTVEGLQAELKTANETIATLEAAKGDWKKDIDPDPESNPTLSKYGTPKDLFNAYSSLVKKMGDQASLIKPPKDANDVEGWNALAKALGVPDNGDGYKFPTINRPEGLPADEKQEGEFRKLAHDLKLTPHQVESLYSHVVNKNIEQFNAMQAQQEQVSKTIESEMSTEYGAAWPDKKEAAQKVIDAFAPEDKEIGQKLLNDPAMIRMLVKLGDRLSEDGIITTPGGSGRLSPKEARAEINKIMNDDSHPYHNNEAAGHKDAVDYMTSLYEMESQGQG